MYTIFVFVSVLLVQQIVSYNISDGNKINEKFI